MKNYMRKTIFVILALSICMLTSMACDSAEPTVVTTNSTLTLAMIPVFWGQVHKMAF
jgi:hypothetical protein